MSLEYWESGMDSILSPYLYQYPRFPLTNKSPLLAPFDCTLDEMSAPPSSIASQIPKDLQRSKPHAFNPSIDIPSQAGKVVLSTHNASCVSTEHTNLPPHSHRRHERHRRANRSRNRQALAVPALDHGPERREWNASCRSSQKCGIRRRRRKVYRIGLDVLRLHQGRCPDCTGWRDEIGCLDAQRRNRTY
jgi:hypothetical protein